MTIEDKMDAWHTRWHQSSEYIKKLQKLKIWLKLLYNPKENRIKDYLFAYTWRYYCSWPLSNLRCKTRTVNHFKSIMTSRSLADWQESQRSLALGLTLPSPGSTTLEDVLDSLLGLPSQPTRVPTPQPSPRKATSPFYLIGGKVYTYIL